MPIWQYHCEICGEIFKTKRPTPEHCATPAIKLLAKPAVKWLEKDPVSEKSNLVGQDAIFLERSRNYVRDHELDDLIMINKEHTNPEKQRWINDKGQKRTKLDDL